MSAHRRGQPSGPSGPANEGTGHSDGRENVVSYPANDMPAADAHQSASALTTSVAQQAGIATRTRSRSRITPLLPPRPSNPPPSAPVPSQGRLPYHSQDPLTASQPNNTTTLDASHAPQHPGTTGEQPNHDSQQRQAQAAQNYYGWLRHRGLISPSRRRYPSWPLERFRSSLAAAVNERRRRAAQRQAAAPVPELRLEPVENEPVEKEPVVANDMGVIRKKTATRVGEGGVKYHCDVCSVDVTSTVSSCLFLSVLLPRRRVPANGDLTGPHPMRASFVRRVRRLRQLLRQRRIQRKP